MELKSTPLSRAVWGFVIGDALGVPVEFQSREELKVNPLTDMIGWGTYHQPPGTWSDDSSMMLCTLENLQGNGGMTALSILFVRWFRDAYMTPHNDVFDIGNTTRAAIKNLIDGEPWFQSGIREERIACGNGSLMRVLPFAFFDNYVGLTSPGDRFRIIEQAGSITHSHALPNYCCFLYVEWIKGITEGLSLQEALSSSRQLTFNLLQSDPDHEKLLASMKRILTEDFALLPESAIRSGGYVVHTLEAVIWSCIRGEDYRSIVITAVNLGEDTDTVAALAGAVAGLIYGPDPDWKLVIAGGEMISSLLD